MNKRSSWALGVVLGLTAGLGCWGLLPLPASAEVEREMATGINIPGGDIANFPLQDPDPAFCRQACDQTQQCVAWTFVKPGIQGSQAMCWLKGTVGGGTVDPNTISGVKPASGGTFPGSTRVESSMSLGFDLPGSDIGSMTLPRGDPSLCQQACDANGQCQAWTFVKPGAQGPAALCFLKNVAPRASPNDNTISGLRLAQRPDSPAPPTPAAGGGRGGPAGWGVWASAAGGDFDDPCAIMYVAAPLAENRFGGNPAYVLVRTRASQQEADLDIDHFGPYNRDQPDDVVKFEPCEADLVDTSNVSPGGGQVGGNPTDIGVWASAAGGQWSDPCAIQYNATQLAGNRYDSDPGYVRVRTRATQAEAALDLDQFSRYGQDQPDGMVKLEPCEQEELTDGGTGGGAGVGGSGNVPNLAGSWRGSNGTGSIYTFSQEGSTIVWRRNDADEVGNATVSGSSISARYSSSHGTGSSSGTIDFEGSGRAVRIRWGHGEIFVRQ